VRYETRCVPNADIARIIAANSRTPELVLGDIGGQLGADRLGERRLTALVRKHGAAKIRACYERLFEMARARVRLAVAGWKDGRFEAERFVDDDGVELDRPVRIHVAVDKHGDALHFDFTASAGQTKGPANIRPSLVQAACAYCLISLIDFGTGREAVEHRLEKARPAVEHVRHFYMVGGFAGERAFGVDALEGVEEMHPAARAGDPRGVVDDIGHVALKHTAFDKIAAGKLHGVACRPDQRLHAPGNRLAIVVLIVFVGAANLFPRRRESRFVQEFHRLV